MANTYDDNFIQKSINQGIENNKEKKFNLENYR